MERNKLNDLSNRIIGLALSVHKGLGPGFDEKIYSRAFEEELNKAKVEFDKESSIEVKYRDKKIGDKRVDFIVDSELILEIKAVEEIENVHLAQLLSYLKAIDKRLGLVLNFGSARLGIRRVVNNF
ncbi:MAG: GxxExxY protein [Candidatus Omnitrophica bacterium]|nr:GxxExxY protein [Candidatus Omnitrophota bacterium]